MSQAVAEQKAKVPKRSSPIRKTRLWVRAKFNGFRRYSKHGFRSKAQQNVNQTILSLEGVNDRQAASYYFGKRVVYVFKTASGEQGKKFKVISNLIADDLGQNQQIARKQRKSISEIRN